MFNFNEIIRNKKVAEVREQLSEWVQEKFVERKDMYSPVSINGMSGHGKNGLILLNLCTARIFELFDYHEYYLWYDGTKKLDAYYNVLIESQPFMNDIEHLKMALSECKILTEDLANIANALSGNTISLYELKELYKREPRLYEISRTNYEESFENFTGFENLIASKRKEFYDIVASHPNTSWGRFCKSKCFNPRQVSQITVAVGPRPDAEGKIQAKPIFSNFISGVRSLRDRFIMCASARKTLIQSHINVRSSGYLNRRLTKLCSEIRLSDTGVYDCGTLWHSIVSVDNKDVLKRFARKLYWNGLKNEYEEITMHGHDHLIGQQIMMRSSIYCNCVDGICKTCYGGLYEKTKDYNIGKSGVTILTRIFTQSQLSAKHHLATDTPEITWPMEMREVFDMDGYHLTVKPDASGTLEFALSTEGKSIEMTIEPTLVIKGETVTLPEDVVVKIAMDQEEILPYALSSTRYSIPLKDFTEEVLFVSYFMNNEVSVRIMEIEEIIDRMGHLGCKTPDEMLQRILRLCCEGGIYVNSAHIELIIKSLIFEKGSNTSPFWDVYNPPEIEISTTAEAIIGRSIATGLTYERIPAQLKSVDMLLKKNRPTITDFYFGKGGAK